MAKAAAPSDTADKFMLRLPDGTREKLRQLAEKNGRSMNAEAVQALDAWIARGETQGTLDRGEVEQIAIRVGQEIAGQLLSRLVWTEARSTAPDVVARRGINTDMAPVQQSGPVYEKMVKEADDLIDRLEALIDRGRAKKA